jgi:hypothetical protein
LLDFEILFTSLILILLVAIIFLIGSLTFLGEMEKNVAYMTSFLLIGLLIIRLFRW